MLIRNIKGKLEQLHELYGRDQELPDILDALNLRLLRAREMYGKAESIPRMVSGLYDKLDRIRALYGNDQTIDLILDEIIARRMMFNSMVELLSKTMVTSDEHDQIKMMERHFRLYVRDLTLKHRAKQQGS
jgi:hypothetical protein